MNYQLQRSKRKTISISVDFLGRIIVKAPMNTPVSRIETFLGDKKTWIEKRQRVSKNNLSNYSDVIDRSQVLFLGKKYPVRYQKSRRSALNNDVICVYFPENLEKTKENTDRYMKKAFRKFCEEYLEERVRIWADKTNCAFGAIKIVECRKKWGSCDSKKELRFNWRLIMLPPQLIDYVIVHELTHTKFLDHSPNFWNELSRTFINYKTMRRSLEYFAFVNNLY